MTIICKTPNSPEIFLDALFDEGILFRTGVDGLYGRSQICEDIIDRFSSHISGLAADDGAIGIHFPPGMPRRNLQKAGYFRSFPQLAGCVHSFVGDEAAHARLLGLMDEGDDWSGLQVATDVVLTPAACYPLYPVVAAQGPLAPDGTLYELTSYCFRHEPSQDPGRMQLFRQKEFVRIGKPDDVLAFRETWLERARNVVAALGLPCTVEVASDPFFGRAGRVMSRKQRDRSLKFELLIPVASDAVPTACISFNYHQTHFGTIWEIRFADGTTASSACVGFGLERIALALFRHHGTDTKRWPSAVRRVLWG